MSIDLLHDKIRKLKNPLIVDFTVAAENIPPVLREQAETDTEALGCFCRKLIEAFKGVVPGLRFSYGDFSLKGTEGLLLLSELLAEARKSGFITLLDAPDVSSPLLAAKAADALFLPDSKFTPDIVAVSPYIGSDAVKPFLAYCKAGPKALAVTVRSPNKSASELQDLITGSRQVYGAAADMAARYGEGMFGKCGYSQVCALVSATAPDGIRTMRSKYKYMFLLVDGIDYPSGNAKNCSAAFDRYGHGAAVCVGAAVTAAWKEAQEEDYAAAARSAAERISKNLQRYVTIL